MVICESLSMFVGGSWSISVCESLSIVVGVSRSISVSGSLSIIVSGSRSISVCESLSMLVGICRSHPLTTHYNPYDFFFYTSHSACILELVFVKLANVKILFQKL
jgi:hypothetical protein